MDQTCLIVGGGIGGMSAAIVLARQGFSVELIDLDPEWRVYGAGISVTRPSMRAFRDLGVIDDILAHGFAGSGIRVCNPAGEPLYEIPDPDLGDVPGSGGIMRPALHVILSERVRASGAKVRLGVTADTLVQDGDGVEARFSDGTTGRYGFVVGADGLNSRVRSLIMPDAPQPQYTGQYIWRVHARRPPEIDRRHYFLGGPVKTGVAPVSPESLYLFMLLNTPRRAIVPDEALIEEMSALLAGYGGIIGQVRDGLGPQSGIIVRPLEAFLLPSPWHVGRVILIGDAAHPTTPQLASGAGMAVEDALVLGDELARSGGAVEDAFAAFEARRGPRCRLVVENSLEIGRREQRGEGLDKQTELVAQSLAELAKPI